MEVARINSFEFPTEKAMDEFIALREKQGAGSASKYATIQMAVRTSPTSLLAVLVFPNQAAADAGLVHRNKVMAEIKFKEEWFLEGEFLQLYQNHMARKLKPE